MIDIRSLVKRFGDFTAVDGVSFTVNRGEILGFLGPNGAGKSTTMKMVTGYLAPTSGTAVVCGHDVSTNPLAVKEAIGYLPEGAPAYPDMTPEGLLHFVARVRGFSGTARSARVDDVAGMVHLEGVMRQPIDTLSKGYKRRVGLACALIHDPDVLIMDEPTDGLDPNQKHEVRALITRMASRKAILLSTHILEEVEAICTRAVIIARGRIALDGTPAQLQTRSRYHNSVTLIAKPRGGSVNITDMKHALARVSGAAGVEVVGDTPPRFTILAKPGASIVHDVNQFARAQGWEIDEIRAEVGRLDDVFRDITGRGGVSSQSAAQPTTESRA
jgi:ABC-2 type transport system ATP-binding protein